MVVFCLSGRKFEDSHVEYYRVRTYLLWKWFVFSG